jgi:hypothetical protein
VAWSRKNVVWKTGTQENCGPRKEFAAAGIWTTHCAKVVRGRVHCLQTQGTPTTDYAADLVDHLRDIHNYSRQHLKLVSDRMKTRYDELANFTGYQEGDRLWLYGPNRTNGKSPKLQSSWEGPFKVVTRINDVVYRTQKTSRSRMMIVHLVQGVARDERT